VVVLGAVVVGLVVGGGVVDVDVGADVLGELEVLLDTTVVVVAGSLPVVAALPSSDEQAANTRQPKPSAMSRERSGFTMEVSSPERSRARGQSPARGVRFAGGAAQWRRQPPGWQSRLTWRR
jgi:hypothetical protein